MRERHVAAERLNAIETLKACGVPVGADFHQLDRAQVGALLVEADRVRYRRPRDANGSRGRYFHDLLQRRAQTKG
jgi:hypothetical protein